MFLSNQFFFSIILLWERKRTVINLLIISLNLTTQEDSLRVDECKLILILKHMFVVHIRAGFEKITLGGGCKNVFPKLKIGQYLSQRVLSCYKVDCRCRILILVNHFSIFTQFLLFTRDKACITWHPFKSTPANALAD